MAGVGKFFNFLKTTPGYILCIFVPFALLILSQSVETVRLFRRYKGEQMAELQALRAQLGQNAPEGGSAPVPDSAPAAQPETPAARPPPRIPRHLIPPTAVAKSLSSPLTKTIPAPTTPKPRPVLPVKPEPLPKPLNPATAATPNPCCRIQPHNLTQTPAPPALGRLA